VQGVHVSANVAVYERDITFLNGIAGHAGTQAQLACFGDDDAQQQHCLDANHRVRSSA
jgi:hypothetical protein